MNVSLINYMLKQVSRFRFSRPAFEYSTGSIFSFFQNPFPFDSPPIHRIYRVSEVLNSPSWITLCLFRACRVHLAGCLCK
jgi:hypothetical protein